MCEYKGKKTWSNLKEVRKIGSYRVAFFFDGSLTELLYSRILLFWDMQFSGWVPV